MRAALPLALMVLAGCQQGGAAPNAALDQDTLNQLANELKVTHRVVDNRPGPHCREDKGDGSCYRAEIVLQTGETPLPASGWELRFSQVSYVQGSTGPLAIEHINGDLHRMVPQEAFAGVGPQQTQVVPYTANFWSVSNSDPMPNYYLVAEGLEPVVINSTREVRDPETGLWTLPFVEPLTDLESQLKRTADDNTPQATPGQLFTDNAALAAAESALPEAGLIPTPRSLTLTEEAPLNWSVGYTLGGQAFDGLDSAWERLASLGFLVARDGVELTLKRVDGLPDEGYRLNVSGNGILVEASTDSGAFYGLQSLAGLIRFGEETLPALTIEDAPRYDYRGMHLDLSRNFPGEAVVYKIVDQMAAYKLNKLHLHLADDEGWRLAIPGLPELTEIGSRRCAEADERDCLLPQLGSGVDSSAEVNGYFSRDEYIDLLRYAAARHIEVIPSLDMPGHSRAAVRAMAERHRRLMAEGRTEEAGKYLLSDLEDAPEYLSVQYYTDNTINPCLDSSYTFLGKVLDEVQAMHQEAGTPLNLYHIGADETAGAWEHSPRCEALIASEVDLHDTEDLLGYFIRRVVDMLAQRGIRAGGWSDGLLESKEQLSVPVTSYSWDLLAWGGHNKTHEQLSRGWDVVLSSPDALYFDFPYEADANEGGYYWGARAINTHKIFTLMPDNLPAHAEIWRDRQGNPYEAVDTEFPLKGERIRGIQGQFWSETVRHADVVEYKLFPRLLALAERAWHRADWELAYVPGRTFNPQSDFFQAEAERLADWQRFAALVGQQELAKLDKAGIGYRIPTAGGQIEDGTLNLNLIYPGLALEYRMAEGDWQPYLQPVDVKGQVEIRARSANGERPGRSLWLGAGIEENGVDNK
ncbi:family 20 glycosylhydrolase [Ferrimonas balearica]|uniref:family 20 glycosylhydrolase n=1 Tax=Ferrimonas balearica TaxID=44012 RepID=UPI001C992044|nr:family 20 glycosylhydrolase [Ferrimonas balearica]MBY5921826.1 carbohydate-binding domain-containing protein [Ferrimonas balearica]MBY5994834.1 carbohydate-binding domain-containing protein [Ferrimonas balearica]